MPDQGASGKSCPHALALRVCLLIINASQENKPVANTKLKKVQGFFEQDSLKK